MSNLTSRVLVAALLAPAALAAAWIGGLAMLALALVATALALHELFNMARATRPIPLTGHVAGLAIVLVAYASGLVWTLAIAFALLVATFLVTAVLGDRESGLVTVAVTCVGTYYVAYGVSFLVLLRETDAPGSDRFGFSLLLAVFLGTWCNDIAAYFGGRAFGRRRLWPAVSPKKTVEGLAFGLVFGTLAAWFALYDQGGLDPFEVLLIAAAISIAGPLGDLFESFIKRDLGVKDSGTMLGGHGGVLDRIDALLFSAPAAYFALLAVWP